MYIILGCDDVGSAVARNLSTSDEEIFVIDNDESALIGLKEFNIRTHLADIHTLDLSTLPTKGTIAFVLLQKTLTTPAEPTCSAPAPRACGSSSWSSSGPMIRTPAT